MTVLWVALGSAAGGVARYLVSLLVGTRGGFPTGTLAVNVLGSLAIGILSGLLARQTGPSETVRAFAVMGFCGGFTTFSTFSNDFFRLVEAGRFLPASLYVILSLFGGFAAVVAGYALVR